MIMLHGYKYAPGHRLHCPHSRIFSMASDGWPPALGFGTGRADEGLGIAFGWSSRASLRAAHGQARALGEPLARVIRILRTRAPERPVHVIAHSLGSETALSCLAHLPGGSVDRMLLLTGASYRAHAALMLQSPAGRTAEVFNVTSRENDLFDTLFEKLVTPLDPLDGALGRGIDAPNVLNLQLDCPETLATLAQLGLPVAPSERTVCHWSSYTRPGVMGFYRALMREPSRLPLPMLAARLPAEQAPRWSRLRAFPEKDPALPHPTGGLAHRVKRRIMALAAQQGNDNEHAY
jgi:pimeloyl-ACP methyl ester carboxylesterase